MTKSDEAQAQAQELPRDFVEADDPFALFDLWMTAASEAEPSDPNAMTLATVDPDGLPNARVVLLKEAGNDGFVFYTNCESAKGRELETTPKAALCFHWKSFGRQIRIRGSVTPVTAAEADSYFASRPHGSRIGAWASKQSRPLSDRQTLDNAVESYANEYPGDDVPRPPYWSGYRLVPVEIEFWQNRPSRLHDRVRFGRETAEAPWHKSLLYP